MTTLDGAPLRFGRLSIVLVLVGTAVLLTASTFLYPSAWADPFDWRYYNAVVEADRVTVARYHQLPLWNPYLCGGEVSLANPNSTVLAPTFLLVLLFGTPLGMKLGLLFYYFCALHGTYLLARRLRVSQAGALMAALAFGTCGWLSQHFSQGHFTVQGVVLLPYMLVFYLLALERSWLWSLGGAAMVAWMAFLGGIYTLPAACVMLGTMAVGDAAGERRWRPLIVAVAIGVAGLALGAIRLIPALEFALDHPRAMRENDANHLFEFVAAFFSWQTRSTSMSGHLYRWHEYCSHIAYVALGLALVATGAAAARTRRRTWLPMALFVLWSAASLALPSVDARLARLVGYQDLYAVLGIVGFWLLVRRSSLRRLAPLFLVALGIAAGMAWPHGFWWLLRKLPLYRNLRVPSRYFLQASLVIAVWAGIGLDLLLARLDRRGWRTRRWAVLLLALAGVEGLAFSAPLFAKVFRFRHQAPPAGEFYQERGQLTSMFTGVMANRGTLDCEEEAPLVRAGALEMGSGEQVRLLDPSAGSVSLRRWSPNQLVVVAHLSRPAEVLVNLNWNEHWKCDQCEVVSLNGPEIERTARERGRATYRPKWQIVGQLAFRASAGERIYTLTYRPRSFVIGAWVSAAAWLAAIALLLLHVRRARTRTA